MAILTRYLLWQIFQRMKNYLTYRVASSLTLALFFLISACAFNPQARYLVITPVVAPFFLISACAFNPQARSLVITHVLQRPSYHLRLRLQPAGTFPSYHPCGSALPIPACAFNFPQVSQDPKVRIALRSKVRNNSLYLSLNT